MNLPMSFFEVGENHSWPRRQADFPLNPIGGICVSSLGDECGAVRAGKHQLGRDPESPGGRTGP